MSITIILVLIGLILLVVGFMYIEPMMAKHKLKSDNEYGSARFSSTSEIKKYFTREKISNIKEAGIPIWYSENLKYVWFDKQTPHYVYLGSTGSGKSVTAVIPTCSFMATAKEKRSVFITDPKGEIYHTTSKMFKDNGYEVLTIDFRNPELSNKINILDPVILEYEQYIENEKLFKAATSDNEQLIYNNKAMYHYAESNRLITSLATMVMQEKGYQKDPFWNNSAKNLLEGLIGFFLEEYKLSNIVREQITMTSIRKFQNSSMEESNFEKFKNYIDIKEYGNKSKDSLTSILSASDNTYKSITAVFGEKMAIFDDINVANVTSTSDFRFDILGTVPTALFVIVPDEDKTYYTLVTIIVGLLYRELVKSANSRENKKLKVEIDWLLDEFGNCPPLADIEAIVSVARSRGMRFQFFIQSLSQLDNVYGKEVAQIILDNCGLVYLKTNTQETAEAISKRLGKRTIESNSISQSVSILNYNGNKSTTLIARDLLTADEVKQLHYKTIIFPIIGYPILRDTIIYNKINCYKVGEVEREIMALSNLTETYFTVEKIGNKVENLSKEELELLKEKQDLEIQKLRTQETFIENYLKRKLSGFEYKIINNATYLSYKINKPITQGEMWQLQNQINNEFFHLNFILDENSIGFVELHLKNSLGKDMFNNV
jgi:Type IV secretory pathway, VirD4 components